MKLCEKESSFKPSHLLVLMSNAKPHASAEDKAFWDRLHLVTFNTRFVERPVGANERARDPQLLASLAREASGILAWLVRGALAWQREGLNPPASVLAASEAYREEEDQLAQFIAECCVLHPAASVLGSALFTAYSSWGKENNLHGLLNGNRFGQSMGKRASVSKMRKNRGVVYHGIRLLEGEETLFEEEQTEECEGKGVGCVGGVQALSSSPYTGGTGTTDGFKGKGVGCVGTLQGFLQTEKIPESESYRGISGEVPTHPTHPTLSVEGSGLVQPVEGLEADSHEVTSAYTHPTPSDPTNATSVEREGCAMEQVREDDGAATVEWVGRSDDELEAEQAALEAVNPPDPFWPPAEEEQNYNPFLDEDEEEESGSDAEGDYEEEECLEAGTQPFTQADLEASVADAGWPAPPPDDVSPLLLWDDELLPRVERSEGRTNHWEM